MKSVTIFVTIAIAIVIIVAAALVIRSTQQSSLPLDEDIDNDLDTVNQFVQETPTPPPATPLTSAIISPSLSPSPSPSGAATTDASVSLTDTGFSPAKITIPAGTTVTFTNNGQALHWPASDLHPTHQLLAGFDAKRGLTTGETYTYTFTKVGTWSIHDHLNPSATGVITVQ